VKAGDFGHPLETAVPRAHGLAARDPAALLLVRPAGQQVEMPMIVPVRVLARATGGALALVNC
jgi:hypothetical protein